MARRNKREPDPKIGEGGAALSDDRKKQLAGYVTEIERHNAAKATIQADIGLCFNSAKDAGFDTKALRHIINQRKKTQTEREAFEAVVDVYMHALGDFVTTDLGRAAVDRATAASPH
jgi:uncharacterized protein (UPF0335 family)